MLKVKLFDGEHELDLEDEINQFIDELDGEIVDLKYQVALAFNGSEMEYSYSCMILYEENE